MKSLENSISENINESYDFPSYEKTDKIFSTNYKRHEDLKIMLDSNKDNLKLEAMKRIIGMVAKGKNASHLFPAVVKNVASKNLEVKKLVYVYLVRYAEEQQDLALLSISTFQKGLKDPNQLIRASALRVLSSVRVSMIAPIMMLALKEAMNDLSPYVRKTAALAIPKLYTLDPELKESLVEVIEKLLGDKTTLVVGSVIMAFEEVCPERVDLLHKNYRKLCELLVDVEEWGQCFILHTLTRYARSQFKDPNASDPNEKDAAEGSGQEDGTESFTDDELFPKVGSKGRGRGTKKTFSVRADQVDPDLKLLLKNSKPLLQSRNAAVVMAVVQLFNHCAPLSDLHAIVKPLIRLLRGYKEVQSVVLKNIVTLCGTEHKNLLQSHLKSFFVRSHDPTHIRLLKLEILTALANETNIAIILRELQTYISSSDKDFAAATIQAIGRCASCISEITEACTAGLVNLMHSRNERVVSESVIVIKNLLQIGTKDNTGILIRMAKVLDSNLVINPKARASILWLLGEYCDRVPDHAPDVLRKVAKSFADEDELVKFQVINLASKLYLCNDHAKYPAVPLLVRYVFDLAKYDMSYDVRDRARMLRHLVLGSDGAKSTAASPLDLNGSVCGNGSDREYSPGLLLLRQNVKSILMAPKPAPDLNWHTLNDNNCWPKTCGGSAAYQLGSLSHYLSTRAPGYEDLPTFPTQAPDPTVRDVPLKVGDGSESVRNFPAVESGEEAIGSRSLLGNGLNDDDGKAFYGDGDRPLRKDKPKKKITSLKSSASASNSEFSSTSSSSSSGSESGSGDGSSSSSETSGSSSLSESGGSENNSDSVKTKPSTHVGEVKKGIHSTKKPLESLLLELDMGERERYEDINEVHNNGTEGTVKGSKADYSNIDDWLSKADYSPLTTPLNEDTLNVLKPALVNSSSQQKTLAHKKRQSYEVVSPTYVSSTYNDIRHSSSKDISVSYRFTRKPHIFSDTMVSVELLFKNLSPEILRGIRISNQVIDSINLTFHPFHEIAQILPNQEISANLGINFGDSSQPRRFDIKLTEPLSTFTIAIPASYGEQIKPIKMGLAQFATEKGKLRGMNECMEKVTIDGPKNESQLSSLIAKFTNIGRVRDGNELPQGLKFAGYTYSGSHLVLLEVEPSAGPFEGSKQEYRIIFNCEKILIGAVFLRELATFLANSR